MAADQAKTAEDGAQEIPSALQSLVQDGLSEQANRQENFQLFVRTKADPDEEAAKEFQAELVEIIKGKMRDEEIGLPEAAIALWDEVNRMEKQVREASEGSNQEAATDDDGDDGDESEAPGVGPTPELTEDDADESTADAGRPDDPAFY